jgi:hypothetical protein
VIRIAARAKSNSATFVHISAISAAMNTVLIENAAATPMASA